MPTLFSPDPRKRKQPWDTLRAKSLPISYGPDLFLTGSLMSLPLQSNCHERMISCRMSKNQKSTGLQAKSRKGWVNRFSWALNLCEGTHFVKITIPKMVQMPIRIMCYQG